MLGWVLSVGEDCGWVWVVEGEAKLQGRAMVKDCLRVGEEWWWDILRLLCTVF